jgi:hypothetical protein
MIVYRYDSLSCMVSLAQITLNIAVLQNNNVNIIQCLPVWEVRLQTLLKNYCHMHVGVAHYHYDIIGQIVYTMVFQIIIYNGWFPTNHSQNEHCF